MYSSLQIIITTLVQLYENTSIRNSPTTCLNSVSFTFHTLLVYITFITAVSGTLRDDFMQILEVLYFYRSIWDHSSVLECGFIFNGQLYDT